MEILRKMSDNAVKNVSQSFRILGVTIFLSQALNYNNNWKMIASVFIWCGLEVVSTLILQIKDSVSTQAEEN